MKGLSKLLVGKTLLHINEHNRKVKLEVEQIKNNSRSVEVEVEGSNRLNDWLPNINTYTISNYRIVFVDGSSIDLFADFEIVL